MGKKGYHNRKGGRQRSGAPQTWKSIEKENTKWEEYYKDLNLIPEEEFADFKKACQTPLPLTFRITGSKKHAINVRESMQNDYIPDLQNIEWDGEKIESPSPIAFYPDELAWTVKVGKQVIRKNQPFARFQRFLVVETDVGNISRQEAVSMIPPLVLDVQSHHAVFDMCAAPGSKTSQLIEALHQKEPNPSGFVVANDSDYKRSHMLIHQVKRLNSPNLIVTNHDASLFPRIQTNEYGPPEYLKFDRVLCDVPCSGDGTMRKNINVWKDWNVGNGLGLHPTQVNILQRGLQLLKPGGRLVYSTCSMNPTENESVIAEALRNYKETVHLVDVSDQLPGLVRSPGVSQWKVQAKDKQWKQKGEDPTLPDSVFPPTTEEAAQFHLDRAMRVYPHQQDTGGFFIAVFEKSSANDNNNSTSAGSKREAPESASSTAPSSTRPPTKRYKSVDFAVAPKPDEVAEAVDGALSNNTVNTDEQSIPEVAQEETKEEDTSQQQQSGQEPPKKEKLPRDANEEPFKFLNPRHQVLNEIWKFYQIDEKTFSKNSLMVRNSTGEPVRTIYYVTPQIKEILVANEQRLKFIHAGLKMFAQQRNEGSCKWRVQSEGLELIFPSIGESRVVNASKLETLKTLCEYTFPKFSELHDIDEQLAQQTEAISEGCAFMKVPSPDSEQLVFPMWRGRGSVNIMLPKEYTQELLHRLFKVENIKKEFKNAPAVEAKESEQADEGAKGATGETSTSEKTEETENADAL